MSRNFRIVAKLIIAAGAFWLISLYVDLVVALRMIAEADPALLAGAAVLAVPFILTDSVRWSILMAALGQKLGLRTSLVYTIVSWFFANVAPSNVGADIFRAVQMQRSGIDAHFAVRSVVLSRFASFWSLILVVLIPLPLALSEIDTADDRVILCVVVASGICLMAAMLFFDFVAFLLPPRLVRLPFFKIMSLAADLRKIIFQSAYSVAVTLLGVAVQIWRVLIVFVIAAALGLEISFLALLLFVPVSLYVAMLPVSVNNWGTREAALPISSVSRPSVRRKPLAYPSCSDFTEPGLARLAVSYGSWCAKTRSGL